MHWFMMEIEIMFLTFQKDELIQKILTKIKDNNPVFKSRRHLLKSSLRLTKTLATSFT